jgi:methionyl-tRNA formyltransferase
MSTLRIVFFGTPDFAVESVRALVDSGSNVVAIVTAPDKPSGRGHKMQSPPVKVFADEQGIPCLQPPNLKAPNFIAELKAFKADLQIVVAFRMLPEMVWDMPELGTYNVHASLLPDYRGAAPINWAIINGEKKTGVTTFKLKHEIDTGNILLQKEVEISADDNVGSLHDKLMMAGAKVLVESVEAIGNGNIDLKPQDQSAEPKHAPKIFKPTCQIKWNQPADRVRDFIRGMSPFPTAYTSIKLPDGTEENWKIHAATASDDVAKTSGIIKKIDGLIFISCSDKWLEIKVLQSPGKRRMNADEFLRGLRVDIAEIRTIE